MQPDMKTLLAGARSFVKKAAQPTVKTAADTGMLQQLLDGGRSLVKVAETTGYNYGASDSLTDNPMPSLPVWLSNILTPLRTDASALVNKVKGLSPGSNPLHAGMLGAGVGALGGLAGSALSGDDEEEKSPLRSALMGGVLGGGAGAGVGMLNQHMSPQLPHTPQVGTPTAPRAATMA